MCVHDGTHEWAADKTCWSGCPWARHTSCPLLLRDGCHFTTWLYTLPITCPLPPPLQHEADGALRKARLLQAQRQEEYEKAKVSTSRLEEEQNVGGGGAATAKQLEKRRRLEEEALQKVKSRLQWFLLHLLSITVICFLPLSPTSTAVMQHIKSTPSELMWLVFHVSYTTIWELAGWQQAVWWAVRQA